MPATLTNHSSYSFNLSMKDKLVAARLLIVSILQTSIHPLANISFVQDTPIGTNNEASKRYQFLCIYHHSILNTPQQMLTSQVKTYTILLKVCRHDPDFTYFGLLIDVTFIICELHRTHMEGATEG